MSEEHLRVRALALGGLLVICGLLVFSWSRSVDGELERERAARREAEKRARHAEERVDDLLDHINDTRDGPRAEPAGE